MSSDRLLTFQWQNSGDSNRDRPFESGVTFNEDSKVSEEETGQNAVAQLDIAKTMKVLFAVQANIAYDGKAAHDSPLPRAVISYEVDEFLHIKMKYNEDWWIGRIVKVGSVLGFVPTPAKIEALRNLKLRRQLYKKKVTGPSNSSQTDGPLGIKSFNAGQRNPRAFSSGSSEDVQGKSFFKRQKCIPAYDLVPCMRPVIIVGPSLKGYEITDKMHTAVLDFIKGRFKDRVSIVRVDHDISVAKKSKHSNPSKRAQLEKTFSKQNQNAIQSEIERIHSIAQSLKLLILDADSIDHPNQLKNSCLAPLIVALKISSPKVLHGLIKKISKPHARSLHSQMMAADKLSKCNQNKFDIVLDEHELDDACARLGEFLERYLRATIPSNPTSN